jgi:hypothetical protein
MSGKHVMGQICVPSLVDPIIVVRLSFLKDSAPWVSFISVEEYVA